MKKDLSYYLSLNYASEISVIPEDEGGGFLACIPLLPGCMTDGETVEEAYANLQDAKREWIIDMLDRGMPINEPNMKPRFSGRFVVRVPKTLHRLLAEESEREGISLNQFVNNSLAFVVGQKACTLKNSSPIRLYWGALASIRKACLLQQRLQQTGFVIYI